MKRISTLLFFLSFILCLPASAQLGIWAKAKNYIGTEIVYDMTFSRDANYVYVLGSGAVSSGGSGSPGPYSFFIGKYDTGGALINKIMPVALGSTYESEAYSMAIDGHSNSYITGYFSSKIQIDKKSLSGNGGIGSDYFLAKLNSRDSADWIVGLNTSSGNSITGSSLDVDDSGNVYVIGSYRGTIKLGSFSFKSPSSYGASFFAKYDSNGKVLWAKSIGNYLPGSLNGILNLMVEKHTASPAIYLSGSFSGKQVIGKYTINTTGSDDIMILKYDASGALLKIATYGGKSSDIPFRLKMSSHGRLVLNGTFMGTGVYGAYSLVSKGSQDIFTAMLDTALNVKWARSLGGSNYEVPGMVAFDSFDNVFSSGEMRSSPTWFGKDTLSLSDFSNAYIVKYDSSGKFMGAASSKGSRISSSNLSYQSGLGILVDSAADIYTSGVFSGNASFGDTNNVIHSSSAQAIDVFTAKMKDTIQRCRYFKRSALTVQDASCHGTADGAATLSFTGGLMPYTYSWAHNASLTGNSATGLIAGTYKIKVTDYLGCIIKDSAVISEPSAIVIKPLVTPALCHGENTGKIILQVSGGAAKYYYKWQHNTSLKTDTAMTLIAGLYRFRVTDTTGCSVVDSAIVNEPTALGLGATITNASAATKGSIKLNLSGGTPPYKYNWQKGDTSPEIDSLAAGSYKVSVYDANGCSLTDSFMVSLSSGIAAAATPYDELKIIPNPAHETLRLEAGAAIENIRVYDLAGRVVYNAAFSGQKFAIDISSWPAGMYRILASGKGHLWQKAFSKE